MKATRCSMLMAMILSFALVSAYFCSATWAQNNMSFSQSSPFPITENSSNIIFALNGTYQQAVLNKSAWNFVNIKTNNSIRLLNLTVSAQNSTVKVTSYRAFNTTFGGTSLRYAVVGHGKQIFNFWLTRGGGEWSVTINGVFTGENDGWKVSSDQTVTVTGAQSNSNVTITYYYIPDSFGNGSGSTLPFYQQHSAIIVTAISVLVGLSLATTITVIAKRKQQAQPNQ
jgi:hypothetical protein